MKIIDCFYNGKIEVDDDFDCTYCDECGFCPENSYDYGDENDED